MQTNQPCKTCEGSGFLVRKVKGKAVQLPCPACAGSKKAGLRTKG